MAGATLTTLSAILKDMYEPGLNEQLNNEVLMLKRLETRDAELFGNQAVVALHKHRSGGIGPRPEGGALPTAGNQGYARAVYDLKYLYGIVKVTGPSMAKTRSQAGAWIEALRGELDGIRQDLQKDVSRQIWGDGTAVIATTTSAGAGTADVTLTSAEPIEKGHLYVNQLIDIGSTGDYDDEDAAVTVLDVDPAGPTITVDANQTLDNGDTIIRAGAALSSSVVYEVDGLRKIVATSATSFGGINPVSAGNKYWDNLRDTSGGALTTDNLKKAFNRVRVAGGDVSVLISTFGLQRVLFNQLQSQVRYLDPMKIEGGFKTLEFEGRPFIADVDAPNGYVFLLDERYLKVYSNKGWHFLDEDGHILKWRSGYDEWEAVLARYMQLGTSRRNVQMVMSSLTDSGV